MTVLQTPHPQHEGLERLAQRHFERLQKPDIPQAISCVPPDKSLDLRIEFRAHVPSKTGLTEGSPDL